MEIVLSVKRDKWRSADEYAESADKDFAAIRQRVIERDRGTCQFCGWSADKFQDVHHVNDNHQDNGMENLVVACKLCHACHHIGLAGQNDSAWLIYLPEVSQTELNRLVMAIFVVRKIGNATEKALAESYWDRLMERTKPVIEQWGTASAVDFANKLLELPQENYDSREGAMMPLRLLVGSCSKMVGDKATTYWASLFEKLPTKIWHMLVNSAYGN